MGVSIHEPGRNWPPVYEQRHWWGDGWDALQYGQAFDFQKPFFKQFADLYRVVPQIALNSYMSENSDYTNQSDYLKNCFLCISSGYSEDCFHCMWAAFCKNVVDCLYLERSELCYEMVNGFQCYNCTNSVNLMNCSDTHFSKNCIGCTRCIGCVNLRNKQNCFFNEQCSPEEYAEKERLLLSHEGRNKLQEDSAVFQKTFPNKYVQGTLMENSSGDYIQEVNETNMSFNCRNTERMNFCQDAWKANDCLDITETYASFFCISIEGCSTTTKSHFSMKINNTNDVLYSSHCFNSNDLFGCVGVRNKRYCILNRQYSKEEYESLVLRIVDQMRSDGSWGEHFPAAYSPFSYGESVAQEYFPLDPRLAEERGFHWKEIPAKQSDTPDILSARDVPSTIAETDDGILGKAIRCEATGRVFRLTKQELDFHRQMKLPVPRIHPDERHRLRMAMRNPRHLWSRACMKCAAPLQTTYAPGRPEIVYCEKCYQDAVY